MRTTLGGKRLHSGKKMEVDTKTFNRSTHNLSYKWRSTMAPGTIVPFMYEIGLPGDSFDIELNMDGLTLPTVGPLFGLFKWELDVFTADMRLYNARLHNNELKIGLNMKEVFIPQIQLPAPVMNPEELIGNGQTNIDDFQINPSCLLAYFDIRGIGQSAFDIINKTRQFSALGLLSYWDIVKNYYANKQEDDCPVIHNTFPAPALTVTGVEYNSPWSGGDQPVSQIPSTGNVVFGRDTIIKIAIIGPTDLNTILFEMGTGRIVSAADIGSVVSLTITEVQILYNVVRYQTREWKGWRFTTQFDSPKQEIGITQFPLSNIDDMRKAILAHDGLTPFEVINTGIEPYNLFITASGDRYAMQGGQEGLALRTYKSDLLNNWLNDEWIDGTDGINEITAIDVSGGLLEINSIILGYKVFEMLNDIAVAGGSYDDYIEAAYDEKTFGKPEIPVYRGSLIKEMGFQEVISNVDSVAGDQPLGTLGGRGVMTKKHKGGQISIKVSEPTVIMGLISATPIIDYSQGNKWLNSLLTMDDLHKPHLDEIGFQDLTTDKMAWWDTIQDASTGLWIFKSAGKQPAYVDYMSAINRTYGNFAIKGDSMFMTLNRQYEPEISADPAYFQIKDVTTYIDPRKYNNIFAQTELDSQNFWVHIGVKITARRKMSAKIMPRM